jgi:hypothetical protein
MSTTPAALLPPHPPQPPLQQLKLLIPPHCTSLSIRKQRSWFVGGTKKTRQLQEGITHRGVYCMASVVSFGFFSAVFGTRLSA